MITQEQLDSFLGKSMTDICLNGYNATNLNHCAHFVSHALNLSFEMTCARLVGKKATALGANVRVHEVFSKCPEKNEITMCTTELAGLIFVSGASNFVTDAANITTLKNIPKKHIGITLDGWVWHYSNTKEKVVRVPMSEFLYHYPKQTNALWFGEIPAGARPIYFGQC